MLPVRLCLKLMVSAVLLLCFFSAEARTYSVEEDYLNPDNPDRKAYIQKYKQIAIEEMRRSGIPASIKLAQGILESGDGKSELAVKANNHFGMKCGADWDGPTYYKEDDDYDSDGNLLKSCFRVYEKPADSYYAHSLFLLNKKKEFRYGYLFDLDIRDYKAWAHGLKVAGYATNPRYPDLLIGIIEANELHRYDEEVHIDLGLQALAPESPGEAVPQRPVHVAPNEVVENNGLRMVFAQTGETPRSMENFFGVDAKKITIYNELYEGGTIPLRKNDRVYLQPKRKKWRGNKDYHKVRPGERMYDISQLYGIKLKHLYRKNRMAEGTEPAAGERLALKRKIRRGDRVQLRDPNEMPPAMAENNPSYELKDGENLVDVIRANVNALDMEARVDAYLRLTTASAPVPQPSQPSQPATPEPAPAPPAPATPEPAPPSEPTVVTPPYPSTPKPTQPPSPSPQPQPSNPAPSTPPAGTGMQYYTVQSGDTLYSIARRFGSSVNDIKSWNKLTSNIISIGQKLRVK